MDWLVVLRRLCGADDRTHAELEEFKKSNTGAAKKRKQRRHRKKEYNAEIWEDDDNVAGTISNASLIAECRMLSLT
jgi:hypothetical protein